MWVIHMVLAELPWSSEKKANTLFLCPWKIGLLEMNSLDSDEDTDQWSYEDKPGTSKKQRI